MYSMSLVLVLHIIFVQSSRKKEKNKNCFNANGKLKIENDEHVDVDAGFDVRNMRAEHTKNTMLVCAFCIQ